MRSTSALRWGTSVACVTALSLAVAGCKDAGSPSGSPETSAGSTATATGTRPAEELVAATNQLRRSSVRFVMDSTAAGMKSTVTGVADASKRVSSVTMSTSALGKVSIQLRTLGTDLYLKMDGFAMPGLPTTNAGKWYRVDMSRVKNLASFDLDMLGDPSWMTSYLDAYGSVERSGDRSYRGTLDLTKAAAKVGMSDSVRREYGASAKSVPFEATLDARGRLATMKITYSGTSDNATQAEIKVKYSDWGRPISVRRPPANQVVELPKSAYDKIGD